MTSTWEPSTASLRDSDREADQGLRVRSIRAAAVPLLLLVAFAAATFWTGYAPRRFARSESPSAAGGLPEAPRDGIRPAPSANANAPVAPAAAPAAYAVSFGRFSQRSAAEAFARQVRAKGYQATVMQMDARYYVVSRPFKDRHTAQFWSQVYSEIGLRTNVMALRDVTNAIVGRA